MVPVTPANVKLVLTKMSVSVTNGGCVPSPSVEAAGASCAEMLAVQLAMYAAVAFTAGSDAE